MGKYLNDCNIVVGAIYDTNCDGKIEVTNIEKGGITTIRFIDSGNEYKTQKQTVKYGKIRDRNRDRTKEYVAACNEKHNYKYSYSKTVYTKSTNKVVVTCPTHGDFSIEAQIHKTQQGCPKCGWEVCAEKNRMTTEQFIEKSRSLFGDRFSYEKTEYLGGKTPLIVTCPVHGDISILPTAHYDCVVGCIDCGEDIRAENYRVKFDEFVSRSRAIHGEKYQYVESSYTEMRGTVSIICPIHGEFVTRAYHHVCNGSACPNCAQTGFSPAYPAILYFLQSDDFFKVGVSNKLKTKFRISNINRESYPQIFEEVSIYPMPGHLCLKAEKILLNKFRDLGCKNPIVKFNGWTECFQGISIQEAIKIVDEVVREVNG